MAAVSTMASMTDFDHLLEAQSGIEARVDSCLLAMQKIKRDLSKFRKSCVALQKKHAEQVYK